MDVKDLFTLDYLLHRVGEKKIQKYKVVIQKDLQGNSNSPDFLATFGNSNISAYVGFIDLANFSIITHDMKPDQVDAYLNPFLTKIIDLLNKHGALIDKMIGDEIMFVLPETEENLNPFEILEMGKILGGLHNIAFELSPNYKFRIGLSYGKMNVYHLKGNNYSEWSVLGEPVNIAKRLHSLKELEIPNPICGAFGLPANSKINDKVRSVLKQKSEMMVGFASRYNYLINSQPKEFKGVGYVDYCVFIPE